MGALALCLVACPGRRRSEDPPANDTPANAAPRARATPDLITAGASCRGRDDCARDQSCVDGVCTHRHTSRQGEILAEAARGILAHGDEAGAVEAFEESLEAFAVAAAPVPPDLLCDAADAALRVHATDEAKERGARWADRCLRGSLPGSASRRRVAARLARLRHGGLDLSAFDAPSPSTEPYFSGESFVPPLDAIDVEVRLGDGDQAGLDRTRELLMSDDATRAIANCFGEVWAQTHPRRLEGALVLEMNTRLREVGDAQLYIGRVRATAAATDPFSECAANALDAVLDEGIRLSRSAIWQEPVVLTAALH